MLLTFSISVGFPNELAYFVCLKFSLLLHPGHSGFTPVAESGNYEESHKHRLPMDTGFCPVCLSSPDPFWDCPAVLWCYVGGGGISVPVFPFNRIARIKSVRKNL